MKPCRKNRKLIAWLSLGELAPAQEQTMRAHLAQCEGCRDYYQELTRISEALTAATQASQMETSDAFHQNVMRRLRGTEKQFILPSFWPSLDLRRVNWRVAIPVCVSIAVCALLLFRAAVPPQPKQEYPTIAAVLAKGDELSPSIWNYQVAANRSFARFDDLLTKQARRDLVASPVYRASSRPFAADAD